MKRGTLFAIAGYASAAILTYGHAAATLDSYGAEVTARCEARRAVRPDIYCENYVMWPLGAVMIAPFWPLYWSWQLQR